MMSYTQLAQDERYAIYFMNKRGEAKKTIAEELGRSFGLEGTNVQ